MAAINLQKWIALIGISCLVSSFADARQQTNDNVPGDPYQLGPGSETVDPVYESVLDPFEANSNKQRPTGIPISLTGMWMTDSDSGLATSSFSLKLPILKIFGTPPPIVKTGFTYTDLFAATDLGLPNNLYEYSIGVSIVKPINDRWVIRSILGVAFSTDNENTSSDAWQFRGGAFGVYRANERWQWSIGAIALGRSDIPVVPAIGAVWTPNSYTRWDLIPPNPKVNFLIADVEDRQHWIYVGGGFNGTTWGYESTIFGDDTLTYSDLRLVTGWRSTPRSPVNAPFVRGRKNFVEFGYSFSRDLEFNDELTTISLDDAFLFRLGTEY
ncbi:MAG: DUF6268 family outer membrane beta-barrel protein [Planctomycetota bacterium]